ncbi:CRTAC1 family protein [Wenzhouxiangella sp. XN79A]|uniref:CRTAC1 family protein n=1 Tax=Wenzhouxiangella sp. XN79A TaxID=2724193 RepID=UPI00144A8F4D|nr:CRTAC1 family protein [Wenzhouxiangella sp. XN79A]NKI36516.1 CRTAC1 family protein [Wenzhouxiangella sp. XN79A]
MPSRFSAAVLVLSLSSGVAATAAAEDWFIDVTESAGVDFEYLNGAEGRFWFPEIMGGGAALLDYDGDGRMDLYLVQGGRFAPDVGPTERTRGDRLYRNVTEPGGAIRFVDVTEASGIDARGYGQGVAVADYDADGDPDLYLLNVGDNQLWRNDGGGRFTDVTAEAGVNDPRWSVSASFADVTGDGRLDLFVVNYVDWSFDSHRDCRAAGSSRLDYCSPSAYPPAADSLFVNNGDGTFRDRSGPVGLLDDPQPGLGVVAADFNDDGRVDLYVANDGEPNHYWLNQGSEHGVPRFIEDAFLAGNAVNGGGSAEASMGVDAGDFDNDGAIDLFMTHLIRETNTLYRNDGSGWFTDVTAQRGLGAPSLPRTGFGTAFADLDRDGGLDLYVANGAVVLESALAEAGDPWPYHQPDQLFVLRDGDYIDLSAGAGAALQASHTGRGAAFGDLDNDGRIDVVVANNRGRPQLLRNVTPDEPHWIGIELRGPDGQLDVLPARVERIGPDGAVAATVRARTDGSYASANDPRAVLGLGPANAPVTLQVRWPNGQRERFADLEVDRYHVLIRGQGVPEPSSDE